VKIPNGPLITSYLGLDIGMASLGVSHNLCYWRFSGRL
jgi:hypothetical protein